MKRAPAVFLCYAREDKAAIEAIYRQLKQAGLAPWMDKPPQPYALEGVRPGERWDKRIRDAIRGADFFLAFLSPSSVSKRGFVQREYRMALDKMNELPDESVFLIPVLLAECEPPNITVGQVSFRDVEWYELFHRGIDDLIGYMTVTADLSEKRDLDFGKRLVIDFGTSSSAMERATHEELLAVDFGRGTVDISTVTIGFVDSDPDRSHINSGPALAKESASVLPAVPPRQGEWIHEIGREFAAYGLSAFVADFPELLETPPGLRVIRFEIEVEAKRTTDDPRTYCVVSLHWVSPDQPWADNASEYRLSARKAGSWEVVKLCATRFPIERAWLNYSGWGESIEHELVEIKRALVRIIYRSA